VQFKVGSVTVSILQALVKALMLDPLAWKTNTRHAQKQRTKDGSSLKQP